MIELELSDGDYAVSLNKRFIGMVQLYDNPCHMKNCYVKLELDRLDTEISVELFQKIREITKRPLQVMAKSSDTALIAFLTAAGFRCERKCYEVAAGLDDYIGGRADMPLDYCREGEPDYEAACRMMFDHYAATHKAINPWTAGYVTFREKMPSEVICTKAEEAVESLAFVEGNEIAYVCGIDQGHFIEFARSLAASMLTKYETIFFESDDCDWAAMELRSLFQNQGKDSFDSYVWREFDD